MMFTAEGQLIGVDMDASRVLAVAGMSGFPPQAVALDGKAYELPMAISLEGRTLGVGQAGLALARRLPHLVCHDFLPQLGETQG